MNKKNPDYIVKGTALKEIIEPFKTWLQSRRFAKDTIRMNINYLASFLNWLERERLTIETTTYNNMLDFIDYCRSESKSTGHTNGIVRAVRYYYNFIGKSKDIKNPASGLYVRGITMTVPHGILDITTLETLYNDYKPYDSRTRRNKAILGLLIYQAITTEELQYIETSDIRLKEGKINIQGRKRSNSRTLRLEPFQILELKEYIEEIRPAIQQGQTKQLFISMEGSRSLKASLHHLFRHLKKLDPRIKDAGQIRQSVITHWLKEKDLRTVQYMAGHRYVSSTERYKTNDLTDLSEALNLHHPLS